MTEPDTHRTTAEAYDSVAALYADFARDELDGLPLDRSALAAFAEYVDGGDRPIAELGCGPGRVTAHLRNLGLEVFGVDLSPRMVALARAEHPGIRFEVGSMDALDISDGALGGAVAWYSIIHATQRQVKDFVAEFRRVITPGGLLLVAFFDAGEGSFAAFDHRVTTAYRWPVDELAAIMTEAGFDEIGRILREPLDGERPFRRGHLLMRRRSSSGEADAPA